MLVLAPRKKVVGSILYTFDTTSTATVLQMTEEVCIKFIQLDCFGNKLILEGDISILNQQPEGDSKW